MDIDYISDTVTKFKYKDYSGRNRTMELLWGDRVEVISSSSEQAQIKARGKEGVISKSALGGEPLLEVYFIDVGQGDGVLVVTPDRKHVLIDGGYIRDRQPTGKNAADFVDWKFVKDYGEKRIKLDALIASHCDADHYGGVWDLLSMAAEAQEELEAQGVDVDVLYHAGISWWKKLPKGRWLGPIEDIAGTEYLTRILGDRDDVQEGLDKDTAGPKLQGEWAKFLAAAITNGCDIQRLSNKRNGGFLPGFDQSGPDNVSIKILAPIELQQDNGDPMVRAYGSSNSQNTNGHSLLLQLRYDRTRILLTGDLNKKSMQAILDDIPDRQELQCDVAKGCHHGSDDISYEFLQAMGAAATVISSGDNEGHAHPRPTVVAASAQTGHLKIEKDELITPLIYSTEISRSIAIGKMLRIRDEEYEIDGTNVSIKLEPKDKAKMDYEVVMAGDLNPKKKTRRFHGGTRVVDAVTYGLVNVRTDGTNVLCATLNEKKDKWEIEKFRSRF